MDESTASEAGDSGGGDGGGGDARRRQRRRRGRGSCRCFAGAGAESDGGARGTVAADVLVVGLGNPGTCRRNPAHIGFEIANELARRWQLPRARKRFGGLISEGRVAGGPGSRCCFPRPS